MASAASGQVVKTKGADFGQRMATIRGGVGGHTLRCGLHFSRWDGAKFIKCRSRLRLTSPRREASCKS